jgi:hypothetical protein
LPGETIEELEHVFEKAGFEFAGTNEVRRIFDSHDLLCRNEALSNVLMLINDGTVIEVEPDSGYANMCSMSGSQGFTTAMQEGFSEREVDGKIKTVITFDSTHLAISALDKEDPLWHTKPDTARVSKNGRGSISLPNLKMISLRFPTNMFPEENMTTEEAERYESNEIRFIVRHYIKKETTN